MLWRSQDGIPPAAAAGVDCVNSSGGRARKAPQNSRGCPLHRIFPADAQRARSGTNAVFVNLASRGVGCARRSSPKAGKVARTRLHRRSLEPVGIARPAVVSHTDRRSVVRFCVRSEMVERVSALHLEREWQCDQGFSSEVDASVVVNRGRCDFVPVWPQATTRVIPSFSRSNF